MPRCYFCRLDAIHECNITGWSADGSKDPKAFVCSQCYKIWNLIIPKMPIATGPVMYYCNSCRDRICDKCRCSTCNGKGILHCILCKSICKLPSLHNDSYCRSCKSRGQIDS